MTISSRATALLASAALVTLMTSMAQAGGFALREQSAYGQGSSFAGIAAGGSLSSMFWNPATLSQIEGIEIEAVATGVFPFSDVDVDAFGPFPATDAGDIAQDALLPASYSAYRLSDRLVFGMGVNSPYGLVTNYPDDSPLRLAGIAGTSEVFSITVNPALSFEVTDWLAVALGAQVQYIDVRLTAVGGPNTVEGDDIGIGLTAGLLLTPMAGTEIGLGYRSRIDHKLEGEFRSPLGAVDVTGDGLDLPDIVTLGIRQRITDRFRIMAGAEWSNWSRFDTVELDPVPLDLPFEYEDGWFFSVGGEFDVTEQIAVRAGVGYEFSPIDDDIRDFRLPDNDRLWLSAGASYKANERFAFDLGYSFLQAKDTDILSVAEGGPAKNGPASGEADAHVHIVSAGFKMKFGGPAAPVMDQPMVVKY